MPVLRKCAGINPAGGHAVKANPTEPQAVGPDTIEKYGRPMRVFPVAVS